MSEGDIDARTVTGLTRKLNALKAQLPDHERKLLSSVIAAAAVAGVFVPVTDTAARKPVPQACAAEELSVQEQFASAFTPGAPSSVVLPASVKPCAPE